MWPIVDFFLWQTVEFADLSNNFAWQLKMLVEIVEPFAMRGFPISIFVYQIVLLKNQTSFLEFHLSILWTKFWHQRLRFPNRTQVLLPSIVDMVCENALGTHNPLRSRAGYDGSTLGYTKRCRKVMVFLGKWSTRRRFTTCWFTGGQV